MDSTPGKLQLKSELGLLDGVSLIAGIMIGAGIFMSPQTVLIYVGSPGASLLIWAFSGLLSMLGSFCYAELGTVIRESGGDYIYILRTSGSLMAFMFAYTTNVVVRPASTAGLALGFAQNAVAPFYQGCPPSDVVVKSVATAGILVLTVVNCLSVRCAMAITVYSVVAKCLALVVIVISGVLVLIQGNTENFQNPFEGTFLSTRAIGFAFYQCLWAYEGWNSLNAVTEEIKRPEVLSIYS